MSDLTKLVIDNFDPWKDMEFVDLNGIDPDNASPETLKQNIMELIGKGTIALIKPHARGFLFGAGVGAMTAVFAGEDLTPYIAFGVYYGKKIDVYQHTIRTIYHNRKFFAKTFKL